MKPRAKDCVCQTYDGEVTREDGLAHLACCEPMERMRTALDQAVYLLKRAQSCALDMKTAEWNAARDALVRFASDDGNGADDAR